MASVDCGEIVETAEHQSVLIDRATSKTNIISNISNSRCISVLTHLDLLCSLKDSLRQNKHNNELGVLKSDYSVSLHLRLILPNWKLNQQLCSAVHL